VGQRQSPVRNQRSRAVRLHVCCRSVDAGSGNAAADNGRGQPGRCTDAMKVGMARAQCPRHLLHRITVDQARWLPPSSKSPRWFAADPVSARLVALRTSSREYSRPSFTYKRVRCYCDMTICEVLCRLTIPPCTNGTANRNGYWTVTLTGSPGLFPLGSLTVFGFGHVTVTVVWLASMPA
jgi:hypothetical protein